MYPGVTTEETRPGAIGGQSPLAMDTGTPSLAARVFPRKWLNRPRFDAPGARKAIAEDALPPETFPELGGDEDRGGKPEHLSVPPTPPESTGTKYPDLRSQIADMALPEHDAERRAAAARINAAMPKAVPPLAKEVPGMIHYSVGGGPMRSRALGQGGPSGEDFSATQGRGFGRSWDVGKDLTGKSRGGYMQTDINSLPWEQLPESYKESHMSPAQEAMSPLGAVREKSRLERETEVGRRKDYQASVDLQRSQAQEALANAKTPEEKARIQARLEDQIKTITESFGIGARLTSNALYGGV